jgi:hypothetical protein
MIFVHFRLVSPDGFALEAPQIHQTIPHGVYNLEPRMTLAERDDSLAGRDDQIKDSRIRVSSSHYEIAFGI